MFGSIANAKTPAAAEDRSIQCNLRLPTLTRKHKERERDREGGRKRHSLKCGTDIILVQNSVNMREIVTKSF
jgi:hypothetical protein